MKATIIPVFLILLLLLGCTTNDPETEIIFVTATPEATIAPAQPEPQTDATQEVALQPSPSPTETTFPTLTPPPSFPTATSSPTPEGGISPTPDMPSPTPTVLTVSGPTNTPAGFPTATPSPTIEGIPSPTPWPTLTATEPPQLPTETPGTVSIPTRLPGTEVANVVPPPAISDLAPQPEALPIIRASRFGVQIHPFVTNEQWANALRLTEQLGMDWIKFQMPWDISEPSPGEYSFQYERLVLLVQEAHAQGFRVLVSINRAPEWARPPGTDPSTEGPPADPAAFANFVSRVINDIKPEFMEALEVWNEPNLEREWVGVPMDGGTYMRYFEAAYNAARAIDPNLTIVTAGLAPVGDVPGARDDRVFLREMYAAGLNNFPNARIGVHPYGWANPPDARCCHQGGWGDAPQFYMLETIEDYRQIALQSGDPNRQFWITEIGWGTFDGVDFNGGNSTPPEEAQFMSRIDQEEQAIWLLQAMEILQSEPYNAYVEKIFLWNMNFATIENAVRDQLELVGYSFLDAGGRPRPVFYYLLNTRKYYEPDLRP
ncbi:MAG: beta-galactosidase [Anaerolineales bacterium]